MFRSHKHYKTAFVIVILHLYCSFINVYAQENNKAQLRWNAIGHTKFHHRSCKAAIIQSHQLLVIGGYHQDSLGNLIPLQFCEVIDVQKGNVQDALQMTVPHAEAALVQNGDSSLVIISGVSLGNKPTLICEYYDRFYHSWRQIGKILVPRIQPLATFISNEEILVCGGKDVNGMAITSAEILNIKTGQSKMVAPLPKAVHNAICFISVDFQYPKPIVIASGDTNTNEQCVVYIYHEKKNLWESRNISMPNLSALKWLRLYDNRAVIWGDTIKIRSTTATQNVFIENFSGMRPILLQQLKRNAFSLGQWNNDTLLVVGGYNERGHCDSTTIWIDMLSGKYSSGHPLVSARRDPMLLALPVFNDSGYLLEKCLVVFGGLNIDNKTNTLVEVLREVRTAPKSAGADEELLWGRFPSALTVPVVLILTSGIVTCLVLALVYLVQTLRLQLFREQEYLRTEQEKESLSSQIATLRLQTLQLQMKPHFVYNSLAAVESLVMDNKTEQASYYIRVLAKLFRIVLEHSDHSTVKVYDAIEFLKVYIALEQLRMDYTFDYDITHQLSTSAIQLFMPSMLIQPYIENSIKYGLGLLQDFNVLNPEKRRQGKLLVNFSMTTIESEAFLCCLIEDNGVGRRKAKEVYAKRTSYQGLSRSTRVNEERLSLLSKLHLQVQNVEYVDLYNENNEPIGTRVILQIPVFTQQYLDQ